MTVRPRAVAFDVLETLLNLDPLRERLEKIGQPAQLLHPWFMRFQRDSMALALSGDFQTFESVARQALRTDTGHTATEEDIDYVLDGFRRMPTHMDAEPALCLLSEAGLRVGCLTVGSAQNTARFLEQAGLAPSRGPRDHCGASRNLETRPVHLPRGSPRARNITGQDGAGRSARLGLPRSQTCRLSRWMV